MPDPGYPDIGDLPPDLVAALNDAGAGPVDISTASRAGAMTVTNNGNPQGSGISLGKAAALAITAFTLLPEELVATALGAIASITGWSQSDIVTEALQKKGKGRRRRGITYRQLSTARRVNRTIVSMYNRLREDFPAARTHHHAAPKGRRK